MNGLCTYCLEQLVIPYSKNPTPVTALSMGGKIEKNEMGGACGTYGGSGEVCTGFWWGSLREGDHLGDPDVEGKIILRRKFRKWERVWETGWSWLRIGTAGGHL